MQQEEDQGMWERKKIIPNWFIDFPGKFSFSAKHSGWNYIIVKWVQRRSFLVIFFPSQSNVFFGKMNGCVWNKAARKGILPVLSLHFVFLFRLSNNCLPRNCTERQVHCTFRFYSVSGLLDIILGISRGQSQLVEYLNSNLDRVVRRAVNRWNLGLPPSAKGISGFLLVGIAFTLLPPFGNFPLEGAIWKYN